MRRSPLCRLSGIRCCIVERLTFDTPLSKPLGGMVGYEEAHMLRCTNFQPRAECGTYDRPDKLLPARGASANWRGNVQGLDATNDRRTHVGLGDSQSHWSTCLKAFAWRSGRRG